MSRRWFTFVVAAAMVVPLLAAEKSFAQFGFGRYRDGGGFGVSVGNPYYGGYGWGYGGYAPYGYSTGWYGPGYVYGSSYNWPSAYYRPGAYPGNYYAGSYYTPSYYGTSYAPGYTYSPTTLYPSQMVASTTGTTGYLGGMTNTQSFYPPNVQDNRTAMVNVQVPPDAEIWFEGEKTSQTGASRLFRSPPLETGQNYSYDVKARWMENGKPIEQTRTARVRAGEMAQVNFMDQGDRNTANPADRNPADRDRNPADRNPTNPGDRNPPNPR
jgi:uncharacterized protein (TIGR03000 family)